MLHKQLLMFKTTQNVFIQEEHFQAELIFQKENQNLFQSATSQCFQF